ncbi:ATP-binding protein [Staphylococcus simulans]|uniref:ATP-binding protein n=2 Tax=Staphylococcus simulans TaxID=1286 RepID=UPI000D046C8E|nr:ATP-binding protein [Staphylococcus simulans]AVO01001.1 ATP-binding protein [Staphylococcus simulans]AVO03952.1 ATP-binding protein [Staphylococcus simulans]AWG17548.1 ATP-binding protein [Staphylococcus simulans]AWI00516.1 ATP-binding protein [Staphylococcus simulans]MCE5024219.1 ATP-binding protein [Staphylococcus simulans]
MTRKSRIEKRNLQETAENLLVDSELHNRASNNLEKLAYNTEKMHESIDQQINIKKDLLAQLKERRNSGGNISSRERAFRDNQLRQKLKSAQHYTQKPIDMVEVEQINAIDIDRNDFMSAKYNRTFAKQENIDLNNPFLNLYSKTEQVKMTREIIRKFDLLELDNMDYGFAVCAGLIAGIIDVTLVGTIKKGTDAEGLQKIVDNKFEDFVTNYANNHRIAKQKEKWKAAKVSPEEFKEKLKLAKQNKMSHKGAVQYLEDQFKVLYDASSHDEVEGLYPGNHHLASLGHNFSPLGLLVSIIDQLTGKGTFIEPNTGKLVRVVTNNKNNELSGNIVSQIIQATNNWFGHCMSDISGAKKSKGRGSGLPAPFATYLSTLKIGNFKLSNDKEVNVSELTRWMNQNGYDYRAFVTEMIPVIIYETLIRAYWFYKQYWYFNKTFKDSLPIANSRELSRLLLIGASTFSAIDTTHALIKSKLTNPGMPSGLGAFVMTVNKPGLLDLGFRSFQSLRLELTHRKTVYQVIDLDIKVEYERVISSDDVFG